MEQGIIQHLHRVRGQLVGVEKMIEENRECGNILMQLSAIQSSIQSAMKRVLQDEAHKCGQMKNENRNEKFLAIVNDLLKYS